MARAATLLLMMVGAAYAKTPPALTASDIDKRVDEDYNGDPLLVDDAGYLRRVWIDLAGTPPPPDKVVAFLDDKHVDKRAKVVEELLASPLYAEHFARYWDGVLVGKERRDVKTSHAEFRRWMGERLAANAPWDSIARDLITASGVSAHAPDGSDAATNVNGAVNWLLPHIRAPQEMGSTIARELLGVQIQCAQCHHHPTEKWTQDDFRGFAACFARVKASPVDGTQMKGTKRMRVEDLERPIGAGPKAPMELRDVVGVKPRVLDGAPITEGNPRVALAAWLTAPANPWFARETVNRYWAYLVGFGFFEPIDDQRASNPAIAPNILDALASDFSAHGYDVKRLVKAICATHQYQLISDWCCKGCLCGFPDDGMPDWPIRHPLRALTPTELLAALDNATGVRALVDRMAPDKAEKITQRLEASVDFLFDVDEESTARDYEGTIQQALMLLNGSLVASGGLASPGSPLAAILDGPGTMSDKITALYLRTLSRRPNVKEVAHWIEFLSGEREVVRTGPRATQPKLKGGKGVAAGDPLAGIARRTKSQSPSAERQAWEDLMWALLNSSEFGFRH